MKALDLDSRRVQLFGWFENLAAGSHRRSRETLLASAMAEDESFAGGYTATWQRASSNPFSGGALESWLT